MKVRNGFVSNSSSSSYLIAYDKNSVLIDPEKIVDFIDNHLRDTILFMSDYSEGYDLFELDRRQKNYLLKHKKRFIKYNTGYTKGINFDDDFDEDGNFSYKEMPYVTAFTKVYRFSKDPNQYFMPEADMSDIPEVEVSINDYIAVSNNEASDEVKARVEEANKRDAIRSQREKEIRRKTRLDYLEEIRKSILEDKTVDPDSLIVKYVEVDYNSCDPEGSYDSNFAERYFGLDEDTYYESIGDPELDEAEDD